MVQDKRAASLEAPQMELSWSLSHSWDRACGSCGSLLLPHLNIKAPALKACILSQQFPGSLSSHSTLDFTLCLSLFSYLGSFSLCSLKYLRVFESRTSAERLSFPCTSGLALRMCWCVPHPFPPAPCAQCHVLNAMLCLGALAGPVCSSFPSYQALTLCDP